MEIITKVNLKRCPFCGGKAEMHFNGANGRLIKCISCLVMIKQKVIKQAVEWLEDEIIKDWNKRFNFKN